MTEEFNPAVHDEYAPSEHSFHVDAHPEAKQPTGDRNYGMWGQCVTDSRTTDDRCGGTAKGPHGKCHWHGGSTPTKAENENIGAPEGNQNAVGNKGGKTFKEGNTKRVTHGLYADVNSFYTDVASDALREHIDRIFESYLQEYTDRHGEPPYGTESKLFTISVNMGKEIHGEEWTLAKPDSLDAGHPLVDRSEKYTQHGQRYYEYKERVVERAIRGLSKETRAWLKDLSLLPDADSRTADALSGLKDAWVASASA